MSIEIRHYKGRKILQGEWLAIERHLKESEECKCVCRAHVQGKYANDDETFWKDYEHRCFACLVFNKISAKYYLLIVDLGKPSEDDSRDSEIILRMEVFPGCEVRADIAGKAASLSFVGDKYALGIQLTRSLTDAKHFVRIIDDIVGSLKNRKTAPDIKAIDKCVKKIKREHVGDWMKRIEVTGVAPRVRKGKYATNWVRQEEKEKWWKRKGVDAEAKKSQKEKKRSRKRNSGGYLEGVQEQIKKTHQHFADRRKNLDYDALMKKLKAGREEDMEFQLPQNRRDIEAFLAEQKARRGMSQLSALDAELQRILLKRLQIIEEDEKRREL